MSSYGQWRDGEPCGHPGCLSNVSHPCVPCGRIAGIAPQPTTTPDAETLANRDARIAEIKARVKAATEGPWRCCGGFTPRFRAIASPVGYIVFSMADSSHDLENGKPILAPCPEQQRANSVLMAEARADIPWLLARLAEAEKRSGEFRLQYEQTYDLLNACKASLANVQGERDAMAKVIDTLQKECNALRSTEERLRWSLHQVVAHTGRASKSEPLELLNGLLDSCCRIAMGALAASQGKGASK